MVSQQNVLSVHVTTKLVCGEISGVNEKCCMTRILSQQTDKCLRNSWIQSFRTERCVSIETVPRVLLGCSVQNLLEQFFSPLLLDYRYTTSKNYEALEPIGNTAFMVFNSCFHGNWNPGISFRIVFHGEVSIVRIMVSAHSNKLLQ